MDASTGPAPVKLSFQATFNDIAVHPPMVDETILVLFFLFPFGSLLLELFRRMTPCYIMDRRKRMSMRASSRTSNDLDYKLEAGDVKSTNYSEKQRALDRQEEIAIKKKAAAAAASKS